MVSFFESIDKFYGKIHNIIDQNVVKKSLQNLITEVGECISQIQEIQPLEKFINYFILRSLFFNPNEKCDLDYKIDYV